ncbi:hypothetical protein FRC07_013907 [Ceratobasidium sp. 392]|nr:hypothetical protein FRC07_013907 [Ceratobasidium sp. 392]
MVCFTPLSIVLAALSIIPAFAQFGFLPESGRYHIRNAQGGLLTMTNRDQSVVLYPQNDMVSANQTWMVERRGDEPTYTFRNEQTGLYAGYKTDRPKTETPIEGVERPTLFDLEQSFDPTAGTYYYIHGPTSVRGERLVMDAREAPSSNVDVRVKLSRNLSALTLRGLTGCSEGNKAAGISGVGAALVL